jgi:hypothetical protein
MTDESREVLIKELVTDLKPVRGAGDTLRPLATWLAVATLYTLAIVMATGEFRDGAGRMLLASPQLTLETVASGVAIVLLARAALVSGIPGARAIAWLAPAGAALGVWLALYVAGAASAAELGVMHGKRDHCFWQTVLFGLPSFVLLLGYARSLLPFAPRLTAALAGAAAAAIPGALMQFACLYDPLHTLNYHLSPIPLLAALGAVIGPRVLIVAPTRRRVRERAAH